MQLSYNWGFILFLIFLAIFLKIRILLKDNSSRRGEIIIKKSLEKPIEDLDEIKRVLYDKDILILSFTIDNNHGIFVAKYFPCSDNISNMEIICCKIEKWLLTETVNPKPGKTYKFSVVDGTAMFIQK